MGIGGISIWQLLIILAIILLLFGTKKLRNLGSDLGGAIKGFKNSLKDSEEKKEEASPPLEHEAKPMQNVQKDSETKKTNY